MLVQKDLLVGLLLEFCFVGLLLFILYLDFKLIQSALFFKSLYLFLHPIIRRLQLIDSLLIIIFLLLQLLNPALGFFAQSFLVLDIEFQLLNFLLARLYLLVGISLLHDPLGVVVVCVADAGFEGVDFGLFCGEILEGGERAGLGLGMERTQKC